MIKDKDSFVLRSLWSLIYIINPNELTFLTGVILDSLDCGSGLNLGSLLGIGYNDCQSLEYQRQDKISDSLWSLSLFIVSKKTILTNFLFIIRMIANGIFILTGERDIFMMVPNLFEVLIADEQYFPGIFYPLSVIKIGQEIIQHKDK